jgi:hypothetical protein
MSPFQNAVAVRVIRIHQVITMKIVIVKWTIRKPSILRTRARALVVLIHPTVRLYLSRRVICLEEGYSPLGNVKAQPGCVSISNDYENVQA